MTYLRRRILENLDRYNKFSCLTGLKVTNFQKKTEKGYELIPIEGQVKDHIAPGNVIYYEVELSEIWLEIDMVFRCQQIYWRVNFEIKMGTNNTLYDLRYCLTTIGIKFWAEYILREKNQYSLNQFYVMVDFIMENCPTRSKFEVSDLKGKFTVYVEKIQNLFNFQSKIKCTINFEDLNELIFKKLSKSGVLNDPDDRFFKRRRRSSPDQEITKQYVCEMISYYLREMSKLFHLYQK